MRWRVAVAVVGAMVAGNRCARSPGTSVATEDLARQQTRMPGEYLVTLAAQADAKAIADNFGRFGIKRTQELGRGIFLVSLEEDPGLARMEELQRQDARVRAVQPNLVYQGSN